MRCLHNSSPIDPQLDENKTYCPEVGSLVLEEALGTSDHVELIESTAGSN